MLMLKGALRLKRQPIRRSSKSSKSSRSEVPRGGGALSMTPRGHVEIKRGNEAR
jgi:hypothetical protein